MNIEYLDRLAAAVVHSQQIIRAVSLPMQVNPVSHQARRIRRAGALSVFGGGRLAHVRQQDVRRSRIEIHERKAAWGVGILREPACDGGM
jgi:hypothetical protein